MFHGFGDPTKQIWTAEPQSLDVTYPGALGEGANSLYVTVEQPGALICITRDCEIQGKAVSEAGVPVTIEWTTPLGLNDNLELTVTKHNFRSFEATLSTSFYRGKMASITLTPGYGSGSYVEKWRVWADFNQDGIFSIHRSQGDQRTSQGHAAGINL